MRATRASRARLASAPRRELFFYAYAALFGSKGYSKQDIGAGFTITLDEVPAAGWA